jgi:hypothetical protein
MAADRVVIDAERHHEKLFDEQPKLSRLNRRLFEAAHGARKNVGNLFWGQV